MREIAIQDLNNLQELDNFISDTNKKALTIKGIVVADDGDIKSISADIKELKQREGILKIAEEKLIKLAGIDRVGIAIENSRKQRLLANRNVENAKKEIKNKALEYFISNADDLINKSKATDRYKQSFDIRQIAADTISGKSKGLMDLMKTELGNVELRLDNNARETTEKLAIINEYDDDIVRDMDYLLEMPNDFLIQTLTNRKINHEQGIKRKAERLAQVQIEEAERQAKIKEAKRLAQIEEAERAESLEAEIEKIETEAKIEDESLEAEKIDAKRYRHLRNKDISTLKKGKSHGARGLFVCEITDTKDFVLTEQELDDAVDNEMKMKNAQQTTEKLAIINEYDDDIVRDKAYLLELPDEEIYG